MILTFHLDSYIKDVAESIKAIQIPLRDRTYFSPALDIRDPLAKEFGVTDRSKAEVEHRAIKEDWAILLWDRGNPSPSDNKYSVLSNVTTNVGADTVKTRAATQMQITIGVKIITNTPRISHKLIEWYYTEMLHRKAGKATITVDGSAVDFSYSLFDQGLQIEDFVQVFGEKGFLYSVSWTKVMALNVLHPGSSDYKRIEKILVNFFLTDDDPATEDVALPEDQIVEDVP